MLNGAVLNTERSVYTYFDLLGEVGGLQSTLVIFGQVFMYFYYFIYPYEFIRHTANKIFKIATSPMNQSETTSDSGT